MRGACSGFCWTSDVHVHPSLNFACGCLMSLDVEQKEGEDKARALKVLQAHNAGLTRELGQVDMSLMQALEDNGLTLDSVRLQNTPISRRLGRRR